MHTHTPNIHREGDKHKHNMSFVKGGFGLVSICMPKNGRSLTCRGYQAAICKRLEMQFRKQNRFLFSIGKSKSFVCHLIRVNCGPCWATGTENDVTNREMRILIHYTNHTYILWLRLFLCIPMAWRTSFPNLSQTDCKAKEHWGAFQCIRSVLNSVRLYVFICRFPLFRASQMMSWNLTYEWQVMLPYLLMPMWGL